jgi:hypothetical protein
MSVSVNKIGCFATLLLFVIVPGGAFMYANHRLVMNLAPADLEVTAIVYDEEKNWGLPWLPLPGDNETGVIVYSMPARIAERVAAEGVTFFQRQENRERRTGLQRSHENWQETPISVDRRWASSAQPPPKLFDYLNKYGFGIEIDPEIDGMINRAIQTPGSFYSYGRTGVVIVIPSMGRVVFVYAG